LREKFRAGDLRRRVFPQRRKER